MTTEIKKKSATTVMKEIIDAKQVTFSTKEQQKLNVGNLPYTKLILEFHNQKFFHQSYTSLIYKKIECCKCQY